jgi:hypothetical protein
LMTRVARGVRSRGGRTKEGDRVLPPRRAEERAAQWYIALCSAIAELGDCSQSLARSSARRGDNTRLICFGCALLSARPQEPIR